MVMGKSLHEIEKEVWSRRATTYDALFASISMQAIREILDSLGELEGRKHLDVACGTGHLVAAASQKGAASEGVDFAEPMIEVARKTYPRETFSVADARQLPYGSCSFEVVTCAFGLSHMENPQVAVDEAFRILKPGGNFAFTLWFGAEDGNDFQKITKDALTKFATDSFTLPEKWTQLRFANELACGAITRQSGFGAPTFKRLPIVWQATTAQTIVASLGKLSVRTKMILDNQPAPIQEKIHEYILSEVEARRTNGIISLAWPALLTVVQKSD
jgi:ubiquinone/menaquinone biosynthesis C-methylase UbiE